MPSGLQPPEIQDRLRKGYLDRLASRVKRLRKTLALRDWSAIKFECRQLRLSGDAFGFPMIAELAARAEAAIPDSEVSRAVVIPTAKIAVEQLVSAIDAAILD